jgi:patatin-related protein
MTERAQPAGGGGAGAPAIAPPPTIGDIREVRFAVVLYGGVSLAIYMNGVAQELLRMVRATAPQGVDGQARTVAVAEAELVGTEKVYRLLGQLLEGDGRMPKDIDAGDPIVRRFVIDIMSGSSAGGINGVFLAKALANHQSIDELTTLWVQEGDIAKLINDRGSLEGFERVKPKGQPQSLLNGRRMYRKLLEAFDGMDGEDPNRRSTPGTVSPLADEVDLYVTTTDLQGLRLPLQIANGVVVEQRHRNVFHFRYATPDSGGEQVNDFHAGNNPFLAFAARCTSAFPFAFEPMVLSTIDDDLGDFAFYQGPSFAAAAPAWEQFYRDYLDLPQDLTEAPAGAQPGSTTPLGTAPTGTLGAGTPFKDRQFGDGGSLDNKPFTWATDELLRRRADNPVDRKLVFVEPDPHAPPEHTAPFGPIDSVVAQGLMLPREETVRGDLEAVIERNEIIQRLEDVLLSVETRLDPPDTNDPDVFTASTIDDEAQARGANYAAYRTLRVETVTDDLALLYASALGYPSAPGYLKAIRYLVEAWRRDRFPDAHDAAGGVPAGTTLTYFLFIYDMQYRFRRLNLVKRKIDHVYPVREAPEVAGPILAAAGLSFWPEPRSEQERAFQRELLRIKRVANEIDHRWFRRVLADLRPKPGTAEHGPFQQLVGRLGMDEAALQRVLQGRDGDERRRRAWTLFDGHRDAFVELGTWLGDRLHELRDVAGAYWASQLEPPGAAPSEPEQAARTLVKLTYERFEAYDSVAFPMLFGANVGEADVVEIIRISPLDAKGLRDVEKPGSPPKVAGSKLGHFGAFLAELWRRNDILWGRLDAAEILIRTLVPQSLEPAHRREVVEDLRRRAQASIIREYFTAEQREQIIRQVMATVGSGSSPSSGPNNAETRPADVAAVVAAHGGSKPLQAVVTTLLEDDRALTDAFGDDYRVSLALPPGPTAKTMGRAIHVTGQVLGSTASEGRGPAMLKTPAAWVARVGQVITGVAEAAIPGSWAHLLTRHWLALLYLFEVVAFVAGLVFGLPVIQRWALTAFLLTFGANLFLWVVGAFLRGRRWWLAVVGVLLLVLVAGVIWLAWLELVHLGQQHTWIPVFGRS